MYAPLIDGEQSGIQTPDFIYPEFAMTDDRTPGEVIDAILAVHGDWQFKIQAPGRRPIFRPTPTVPLLKAGPWAGSTFKDSSKNSGREIYNKAIARGTGPAGEQVRVERYAGQLSGVPGELLDRFVNPNFAGTTTGWTATGGSAIAVDFGGGKWSNITAGDTLETTLTDTFKPGVIYRLSFSINPAGGGSSIQVRFGTSTDFVALAAPSFGIRTMMWRPTVDATGVKVVFAESGTILPPTAGHVVDDFTVEAVRPTVVDRRGFTRSKANAMSQAINTAVGEQIADTFLRTHKRAPLKGELTVTGRGGVRRYLGDAAVDPFELLLYTGELIHLADQIDPDTGTIGRDGVIAAVTYNGDDETATVAIDNQRDSFEAAVERYQVVAGAGR